MSRGLLTLKGNYKILDSYFRQIREIQIFRLYIKSLCDLQTCSVCNILEATETSTIKAEDTVLKDLT